MIEVKVPDIGDFADVPVIEVLVSPGDEVAVEDPLITLESDKATMDVPAPAAGKVTELKVGVGDTVSEGSLILLLEEVSSDGATPKGPVEETPEAAPSAPRAGRSFRRPTCGCRWSCWAPARAATRRRSGPPTSDSTWR